MSDYEKIGYKLVEEKDIAEIDSKALVFEHIKTGAKVLKLENDDENNVFSIGFRTPPEDSTGVAHILEHSVLSGSRKYRTKEPFMDIYKSSLQTFLNAMTFADKTIYPIGSRNDKDFENLMDVYLDAVFYPMIGEKPEIFMQEGWHYSIMDEADPIEYKGVVYNEMKGAMSSPEDQVYEFISQSLFPDTIYSNNSGGDPYDIPNLSQEGLVAFHDKYYHPSNSYIFLYGDRDTKKDLVYLDEDYLSHFDRQDPDSEIPYQEPFNKKRYENYDYSTSDDVQDLDRDYLVYSVVLGQITDGDTGLMTSILVDALVNSDAAPIKQALVDARIGEDVFAYSSSIQQVPLSIIAKNTSSSKVNEFEGIIEASFQSLVENGIDKDLLRSSLNKAEYSLREASGYATKGIIHGIRAFDSWLYDESPIKALEFIDSLARLREGIDDGLFEDFIQERILDNPHKTIISVLPKEGLNEKRDEEVRAHLDEYKASLSDEALASLVETNKRLAKIQLEEDSPEAKATIPSLDLEDVDTDLPVIPRERLDSDIDNLYHDIFTGGINYVDLVFDIGHIEAEDISYVSLMADLLGSMDTSKRSYEELSKEIYLDTGGISFNVDLYRDKGSDDFFPKFTVSTKFLDGGARKAAALIGEILSSSLFTNEKRFKDLIKEIKSRYEMGIYQSGHQIVMARSKSYVDKSSKYQEAISGLDYLAFIQDIDKNLGEDTGQHLKKIQKLFSRLLTSQDLLLNFTGQRQEAEDFLACLEDQITKLSSQSYPEADLTFAYIARNEGIRSSANVQYVSKSASMEEIGQEYEGQLVVLAQILNRGYLHNTIRAKGGAYGAGISIGRRALATYSYRDPNLKETIQAFNGMGDYIRGLDLDKKELDNYIIGTMSSFNPALTARGYGRLDLTRYLTNGSMEEAQAHMEEALSTNLDKIRSYADMLDEAMAQKKLCVLGNREKINANQDLFESCLDISQ